MEGLPNGITPKRLVRKHVQVNDLLKDSLLINLQRPFSANLTRWFRTPKAGLGTTGDKKMIDQAYRCCNGAHTSSTSLNVKKDPFSSYLYSGRALSFTILMFVRYTHQVIRSTAQLLLHKQQEMMLQHY